MQRKMMGFHITTTLDIILYCLIIYNVDILPHEIIFTLYTTQFVSSLYFLASSSIKRVPKHQSYQKSRYQIVSTEKTL